jgi:hypothetical protein
MIAAFMMCGTLLSLAQTKESLPWTYRHDVGFNTNIIFQQILPYYSPPVTPFTLMYKRYSSENTAWRYGLTVQLNLNNSRGTSTTTQAPNSYYNVLNSVNVSFGVGREIQNHLTQKWVWYYGADLIPGYNYYRNDAYAPVQTKTQSNYSKGCSIAARPFMGLRFDIHPRLYVSTEFSCNLTYANTKTTNQVFNPDSSSENSNKTFTLTVTPASAIFIFYRF